MKGDIIMKKIISLSILFCFIMLSAGLLVNASNVDISVSILSCASNGDGTFDIELKATATSGGQPVTNQNITLMLAGTYNNGVGEYLEFEYNDIPLSGYIYYLTQKNTGDSNEYTFSFPITVPEEAVNESIYVFCGSSDTELKAETVIPVPTHEIGITVGNYGKLLYGDTILQTGDKIAVVDGYTAKFGIEVNFGYVIDKLLLNGVDISINNFAEEYQTGAVTDNTTLEIIFTEDTRPTSSASFPYVFKTLNSSITFGTIIKNKDETIVEYGVVYSKTDTNPEIGKSGCKEYKANTQDHPMNRKGQYGICLTGEIQYLGDVHYTRAYVITKDKNQVISIKYGEPRIVNISDVD